MFFHQIHNKTNSQVAFVNNKFINIDFLIFNIDRIGNKFIIFILEKEKGKKIYLLYNYRQISTARSSRSL